MSTITIKVPDAVRRHVERLTAAEGITVEQFVAAAAAEKAAAWETEDYIARRARRADPKSLEAMLAKIPVSETPEEWDKIP